MTNQQLVIIDETGKWDTWQLGNPLPHAQNKTWHLSEIYRSVALEQEDATRANVDLLVLLYPKVYKYHTRSAECIIPVISQRIEWG